jgi:hypothetical protein
MRSNINFSVPFCMWFALWCAVILASGCATAVLTQHGVDGAAEKHYSYIHLDIELSDSSDTAYLTDKFIKQLGQRDVQTILLKQIRSAPPHDEAVTALLKVDEVDRRIETVEHRRSYGRTSLTQMRGRKKSDKPVITLRATLIDADSGWTVFQADYVTQGPWHADSATVVAALAGTLVEQLEREGFIATKNIKGF